MAVCQSLLKFFSVGIGITRDLFIAFLKSLAGGSRGPQGVDTSAKIYDLGRVNASLLSPRVDIPTMLPVDLRCYRAAVEISTNVTSERMAVTRHKDRASFNISILTDVKSSPIVGFQTSLPK